MSREALKRYADYRILGGDTFVEKEPGRSVHSIDIGQYIKDKAWSYHASCTAAISADSDPNTVLDSNIRVRGKQRISCGRCERFPTNPWSLHSSPYFHDKREGCWCYFEWVRNCEFFVAVMLSARRMNRNILNKGSRKRARGFDSLPGDCKIS
jgi:hypothetical protein